MYPSRPYFGLLSARVRPILASSIRPGLLLRRALLLLKPGFDVFTTHYAPATYLVAGDFRAAQEPVGQRPADADPRRHLLRAEVFLPPLGLDFQAHCASI